MPLPHAITSDALRVDIKPQFKVSPIPHPAPHHRLMVVASKQGLLLRPYTSGSTAPIKHVRVPWGTRRRCARARLPCRRFEGTRLVQCCYSIRNTRGREAIYWYASALIPSQLVLTLCSRFAPPCRHNCRRNRRMCAICFNSNVSISMLTADNCFQISILDTWCTGSSLSRRYLWRTMHLHRQP